MLVPFHAHSFVIKFKCRYHGLRFLHVCVIHLRISYMANPIFETTKVLLTHSPSKTLYPTLRMQKLSHHNTIVRPHDHLKPYDCSHPAEHRRSTAQRLQWNTLHDSSSGMMCGEGTKEKTSFSCPSRNRNLGAIPETCMCAVRWDRILVLLPHGT